MIKIISLREDSRTSTQGSFANVKFVIYLGFSGIYLFLCRKKGEIRL